MPLRAVVLGLVALTAAGAASAATLTTLRTFCSRTDCRDGSFPLAPLLRDAAGDLFGTTQSGGLHHGGMVFELQNRNGQYVFRRSYSFCAKDACADGALPMAGLIMDTSGNLYGTTSTHGAFLGGTVFKLTPGAHPWEEWHLTTLHDFCVTGAPHCADGSAPFAELTYAGAASGALYDGTSPLFGTTTEGGDAKGGVAFELDFVAGRPKPKERVIHSFCAQTDCPDGRKPLAAMTMDVNGNLFGTTVYGGNMTNNPQLGNGVLFELSPMGRRYGYTILHTFCTLASCADGASPYAPLIFDGAGALLGTTLDGAGAGTVFRLVPNGTNSAETVLYTFCPTHINCLDGAFPQGPLAMDSSSDLFGTAFGGGPNDGGVVYKLHDGTETVLYGFCPNCADGGFPRGGVVLDGAGNLLGTTASAGASDAGTAYQLTP